MNGTVVLNGKNGGTVISNTSLTNGKWSAIQIITDAEFTELNGNITGYSGVTFPAGTVIYGTFTQITLASGAVLAYNKVEG